MTWSTAQQYCDNEQNTIVTNRTDFITHLLALESAFETTSLMYWMKGNRIEFLSSFSGEYFLCFSLGYTK